jgi:hypothetical protein
MASRDPNESHRAALDQAFEDTLVQEARLDPFAKSYKDLKSPLLSFDSRIALAVFSPTFLMAASPKRIGLALPA